MKKLNFKNLIIVLVVSIILAIFAMPAFSENAFKVTKENYEVKAQGSLFNLVNGGIVLESEKIYLNGSLLDKSKSEYTIDYGSSVLIINKLLKIGDRVDVDYCYIPNTAKTASTNNNGLKFQFVNNNSTMNMSTLYNAVDATTGNATYGTNIQTKIGSGLSLNSNFYTSTGDGGKGEFNLHSLSYNSGGLSVNLGYQNSSDDFNGMNYISSQGNISGDDVNKLSKERGLERTNFGLNYAFKDNSVFKIDYNTVGDDNDGVTNTGISYTGSKLNFAYSTQSIGSDFTRFSDLREEDRNALAAEKGMDRTNLTFGYDFGQKGGKLNFSQNSVEYNDSSIKKQNLSYENTKFKYAYNSREVDSAFGNFNGLRDTDKAQLALEAGIKRVTNSLSYDLGKKDAPKWQSFDTLAIETEDGKKLESNRLNFNYGRLEALHFTLKSDNDFNKMSSLTADDKNNFSGYTRKLFNYAQGMGNVDDVDRNSWAGQVGIERKMNFLKYNLTGDSSLTYADSNLSFNDANLSTTRINYAGKYKGKDLTAYYYKNDVDKEFSKLGNLTNIERANYNNMTGMSSLDYGFEGTFGIGYLKATNSNIKDNTTFGGFSRKTFNYALPKYNFSYTDTKVDDAFTRMNDTSIADRSTLGSLKGYNKKEYNAKLNFGSSKQVFDINSYYMTQNHESLNDRFKQYSVTMNYVPNSKFNTSIYTNKYNHSVNNQYNIDNEETIVKMTKLMKFGKLENNSFYTMYRTNSYLDGAKHVKQEFVDFSYKTDTAAKFAFNVDYNIANYSETDRRKSYEIYATQKISDKFGLTFGMGETNYQDADKENRIKYGLTYQVNDSFRVAYNIDKVVKGEERSKDNSSFEVVGKLPKLFNEAFISDLTANFKYDLNKSNDTRQLYNDNYSFSAKVFKGDFVIEKASVLDANTKSWYNDTSKVSYKNAALFGSKLGIEYLSQYTTNANSKISGQVDMYKFNYTLNERVSTSYTLNKGAWNNNELVPVRSEEFALTRKLNADSNLSIKYSQNRNSLTKRDERIWYLSFDNGNSTQRGRFHINLGIGSSYKTDGRNQSAFNYSIAYEYMLNKDKFLSLIASKQTDIKEINVEDYVTDVFGFDYRQSF